MRGLTEKQERALIRFAETGKASRAMKIALRNKFYLETDWTTRSLVLSSRGQKAVARATEVNHNAKRDEAAADHLFKQLGWK